MPIQKYYKAVWSHDNFYYSQSGPNRFASERKKKCANCGITNKYLLLVDIAGIVDNVSKTEAKSLTNIIWTTPTTHSPLSHLFLSFQWWA